MLQLLLLLNPCLIIEILPISDFSVGITLINVHLNRQDWFHLLFHVGGALFILKGCMFILSPIFDDIRMRFPQTLEFFIFRILLFDIDLNGLKS